MQTVFAAVLVAVNNGVRLRMILKPDPLRNSLICCPCPRLVIINVWVKSIKIPKCCQGTSNLPDLLILLEAKVFRT